MIDGKAGLEQYWCFLHLDALKAKADDSLHIGSQSH